MNHGHDVSVLYNENENLLLRKRAKKEEDDTTNRSDNHEDDPSEKESDNVDYYGFHYQDDQEYIYY